MFPISKHQNNSNPFLYFIYSIYVLPYDEIHSYRQDLLSIYYITATKRAVNWSSSLIFFPFEHFAPRTREQRSLKHNYIHFIGVGAVSGQ